MKKLGTFKDLTGQTFNSLTVIKYLKNSNWLCRCVCGNTRIVKTGQLKNGKINSCGCINKSKKYLIDDTFFEEINTEEKAYTLGFIAADGSINLKYRTIKVDQKTDNEDILIKIAKAMKYTNTIKHYKQITHFSNNNETYEVYSSRLCIVNKKMVNDIVKYGITENKSNTLNINLDLIPKNLFYHFLRGMFEGDGSYVICHSKGHKHPSPQVSLTSSTIMIEKIQDLLPFKSYKYHRHEENKENATMIITNSNAIDLVKLLYENATIYQQVKYDKYQLLLKAKGGDVNE